MKIIKRFLILAMFLIIWGILDLSVTNVFAAETKQQKFLAEQKDDVLITQENTTKEQSTAEKPEEIPDWLFCDEESENEFDADNFNSMITKFSNTPSLLTAKMSATKLLLIQTTLPWSSNANNTMLNSLVSLGYLGSYDVISINDVNNADLSAYNVVMLANDQTTDSYNQYASIKVRLENYVTGGGVLIFGACDEGWGGNGTLSDTLPGGVKKVHNFQANNYIVDYTHSIVTGNLTSSGGLTNAYLNGNYCSHTSFDESTLPMGSNVIIRGTDDKRPTLVEYTYGNGTVIASGLTWEYYYGSSGTFSSKSFKDLVVYALSENSNVTSIPVLTTNPDTVEEASEETITQWLAKQPDADIVFGDIVGPSIEIWGYKVPLFRLTDSKINCKIGGVTAAYQVDTDKKIIKVILGYSDEAKASLQNGSDNRTQYGKEYQELKELYRYINGGDLSKGNTQAWNQYQKTRTKLQDKVIGSNGKLAVKAGIQVTGFVTFSYETGDLEVSEGGVVVLGTAGVTLKYQPNIFYCTFGVTGNAEFGVSCQPASDNSFGMAFKNVNAKFSLDGQAGVGVGAKNLKLFGLKADLYAEGGLKSSLAFKYQSSAEEMAQILLSGGLYVEAKAGPFKYTKSHNFVDLELWPTFQQVSPFALLSSEDIDSTSQLIPRDYLKSMGMRSINPSSTYEFNQNDIYPYTSQTLINLEDEKQMMVWVGDDGSKSDVNRSTIMYSVFDGVSWSRASSVYESGTYMDAPVVYQNKGHIYVLWIQASEFFGDNASPTEVLKSCDLYISEYVDGSFTSPFCISGKRDGAYETSYTICSDSDGNAYVYWVQNADTIFGDNGINTIFTRSCINGKWSDKAVVYETSDMIGALATDYVNRKPVLYVVTETEQDSSYSAALYICNGDVMSPIVNDQIESAQIYEGSIYYSVEGRLYIYNEETGIVADSGLENVHDFQMIGNGNNKAIVALEADGLYNELFISCASGDSWSEWEQFTNYKAYIRNYSAVMNSDGTVKAAFNLVDVNKDEDGEESYADSSDLFIAGETEFIDLAVNYLVYDRQIIAGQDAEFTFSVSNLGNKASEGFTATLRDEDGNQLAQKHYDGINAASINEFTISYPVQNRIDIRSVSIIVEDDDIDVNPANDEESTEIGLSDLIFEDVAVEADGYESAVYSGKITNNGYTDAENVVLNIYSDACCDKIVDTIEVGIIKASTSYVFNRKLPKDMMRVQTWGTMNALYFIVTTDTNEFSTANNDEKVAFGTLANLKSKFTVHLGTEDKEYSFELNEDYAFPEELINPERTGYFFAGWYLDEEYTKPYDISLYPEGDVSLYARWIKSTPASVVSYDYQALLISWENIQSADKYELYKYNSETEEYELLDVLNNTEYYDNGLVTGQTYRYRVRMIRETSQGKIQYSSYSTVSGKPTLDAVAGFSADSYTRNSITVNWEWVPGATGYVIYRYDENSESYVQIKKISDPLTLNWTNTGLPFNTSYRYRMRAIRTDGATTAYSVYTSGVKATTCLEKVEIISAVAADNKSLTLTWNKVPGADGYYIYRYNDETETFMQIKKISGGDTLNWRNTGLTAQSHYRYAMKAYCTVDGTLCASKMSTEIEAEVLPGVELVSVESANYESVHLEWNKADYGYGYEILISTSEKDGYEVWNRVWGLDEIQCTINGFETGRMYYFKVRVFDWLHNEMYSPESESMSCKPVLKVPELSLSPDHDRIFLNWNAVEGATGYMVYLYNPDTDTTSILKKISDTDMLSWNHTKLVIGESYAYRIRAIRITDNKTYYSDYSSVKSSKTNILTPDNLEITQSTNSSLKLTWNKVSGAEGYYIYCKLPGSSSYAQIKKITSGDICEWTHSKLTFGTAYSYKIKACITSSGTNYFSAYTDEVSWYINLKPVKDLIVTPTGSNSLALSWSSVEGAGGYYIYRCVWGSDSYLQVKKITSDDTLTWTNTKLDYGQIYSYKIKAILIDGNETYSGNMSEAASACVLPNVKEFTVSPYDYDTNLLTWAQAETGDYAIFRSDRLNGEYEKIAHLSNSNTTYMDNSLIIGSIYYYKICCVNGDYTGLASDYNSAKVTLGRPIVTASATMYTVTLSWNKVKGATGYNIYRYDTASKSYSMIKRINSGDELTWTNTKLSLNTNYKYEVRALAAVNDKTYYSDYSNDVSIKTKPETPANFTVEADSNTLNFSWDAVDEATGYIIYKVQDGTYIQFRKILKGDQTSLSTKITDTGVYVLAIKSYTEINGIKYYSNPSENIISEYYLKTVLDKSTYPESEHNYSNYMDMYWTIFSQDALKLEVTFSDNTMLENCCDHIYLYDAEDNLLGSYTGTSLAGTTIEVMGDTCKIRMTTDRSVEYWGFAVTEVIAYTEKEGALTQLEVKTMPDVTEYCLDEEIDLTGLIFTAIYDNGVTKTVRASQIEEVSYDFSAPGERDVVVTYDGIVGIFPVTVLNYHRIVVDSEEYEYPESEHDYSNNMDKIWEFNYQDAVKMELKFSENTLTEGCDHIYIYDIEDNVVGDYTGADLAGQTITVDGDMFKLRMTTDGSVTFYGFSIDSITVYEEQEGSLEYLEFKSLAQCDTYYLGDEVDLTGMILYAIYDNGVVKTVRPEQMENITYDFSKPGETEVTLGFGGKTIAYEVNVQNLIRISVEPDEYPESPHNYPNGMDETQIFTYDGAVQLSVEFSEDTLVENGFDHIIIYDVNDNEIASYTNNGLSGQMLTISGDTIKIRLTSDGSVNFYGYSIDKITAYIEP